MVLAVDPSLSSTGVAAFSGGVLVHANTLKVQDRDHTRTLRAQMMADLVLGFIGSARVHLLVVEFPQVYRASKSPGDPNDLLGLAAVAGAVVVAVRPDSILEVTPAQWVGQLPKVRGGRGRAQASARATRIRSRLSPAEQVIFDRLGHDGIDAVGLGLYALGRFSPRRVFPGATP